MLLLIIFLAQRSINFWQCFALHETICKMITLQHRRRRVEVLEECGTHLRTVTKEWTLPFPNRNEFVEVSRGIQRLPRFLKTMFSFIQNIADCEALTFIQIPKKSFRVVWFFLLGCARNKLGCTWPSIIIYLSNNPTYLAWRRHKTFLQNVTKKAQ